MCKLSASLTITDRLTVGNGVYDSLCRQRSIIQHLWSHGFGTHEVTSKKKKVDMSCRLHKQVVFLPQDTGIRGQTCNANTHMVINLDQFLLVRSQLAGWTLANDRLVNMLLCNDSSQCRITLSASKMANLSLLKPIAAEPCFTASTAYSTWWIRPWGDQVETSLSYWFLNYRAKLSILQLKWGPV